MGDVGGVVKGLDCTDEREGVEEPFSGLGWTGALPADTLPAADPDDIGR
jgi:hypothetical protein